MSWRPGSSGSARSRPRRSRPSGQRCISGREGVSEPETVHDDAGDGFAVEVPGFSGPFRLLADLILEQKIDVCDVPIASVTDGFLGHTKDAERWSLEEATWFLAICAVLLELKVARLTPQPTELDEEDLVGGSPDLLYARSIELRAFRAVAVQLARRLEDEAAFFTRDIGPGSEFSRLYPDPMSTVTAADLAATAAQLLRPAPALDLSHVTPIRYTVPAAMEAVQERFAAS